MVSATLLYIAETSKAVDPYKTAATVIEPTSSKATSKPLSPRRVVAGMYLLICVIDYLSSLLRCIHTAESPVKAPSKSPAKTPATRGKTPSRVRKEKTESATVVTISTSTATSDKTPAKARSTSRRKSLGSTITPDG